MNAPEQSMLFAAPAPDPPGEPVEVDPRSVRCPLCHANPGKPCMRPSGHRVWGGESHAGRVQRAREVA